jgi:hypothetical protein
MAQNQPEQKQPVQRSSPFNTLYLGDESAQRAATEQVKVLPVEKGNATVDHDNICAENVATSLISTFFSFI